MAALARASGKLAADRTRLERSPFGLYRAAPVLLVSLLVAHLGCAAGLLAGDGARVLQVRQIVQTDARGQVSAQSVEALVRAPGTTADGLSAGWSAALDQRQTGDGLGIKPWPWRDTIASNAPPGRVFTVPGMTAAPTARSTVSTRNLLDQASAWFLPQGMDLAARVTARLAALGLSEAWFSYRQDFPLSGQPRALVWNLHVNAAGVWFAGTPALDSPGTRVLLVRYTSLAAASGLPAGMAGSEAGRLRLSVLDAQGAPLLPDASRDTQGAFDGPQGLACLLGTTTRGCAADQGSIPQWLETYRAGSAKLDYTHALQPVYATAAGGQRYALARLGIDRFLQSPAPGCRAVPLRFTNHFAAAFRVQARTDHYSQDGSGAWVRGPPSSAVWTTPMQPWRTLSVAVSQNLLPALPGLVIDPDSGALVSLLLFPGGIQDVEAKPIVCTGPA